MDELTPITFASCIVLTALVWLMWRAATRDEWSELAQTEKKRWRLEEEKRKEAAQQNSEGKASAGMKGKKQAS